MKKKSYKIPKKALITIEEPDVAYQKNIAKTLSSNDLNPNIPFHGTQKEWWEHFHNIEEGEFMTIEEADKEFEAWREKLLASRM